MAEAPIKPDPPKRTGLVVSVAAVLLALLLYRGYGPQFLTRPTQDIPRSALRVDLNTADRTELLQVPGIGHALVENILEHRAGQRFEKVDDLASVKGIGPHTLEKLRPFVKAEPTLGVFLARGAEPEVETLERKPVVPYPTTNKIRPGEPPINVNAATVEGLQRLPGIGPTIAARIVAVREEKPFASVDDLRRVGGIGAKTLDKLRPFVVVK
jgi:competence protein ComEA